MPCFFSIDFSDASYFLVSFTYLSLIKYICKCPGRATSNAEETLQEWNVEECKVQSHREADGVYEDHVLPQRQGEQRLGRREGVHGVKHLDYDEAIFMLAQQFKEQKHSDSHRQ